MTFRPAPPPPTAADSPPSRPTAAFRPETDPPLGSYASRQAALRQAGKRKPRPRRPRRRKPFRTLLPVLALAGIAIGAVRLLGPQDNQLVTQGTTPSPSATAAAAPAAAGTSALASFAAYRAGGRLAINSLAAANGLRLAVGTANGHPAIWRQGSGSSWSLTDTAASGPLAGRPGDQTLIALADGPDGWLAVGDVVSGAQQHPVVVTSADGQTWQAVDGSPAFSGTGLYTYGAAAGRADYVIVGEQATGKAVAAAAWWSAGTGTWNRGDVDSGGEMFAVTVTPDKFIAAGANGSRPAVWTSQDGQQWTVKNLPLPASTTKAALRQVADQGQLVVATGNAETSSGTTAFAEVSSDDGTTWHEVSLPAPDPRSAVTALTAAGGGFVAAGRSGQAVVWTSADGMGWSSARTVPAPAGGQVQVISSLISTGTTTTGIGVATLKSTTSPVQYTLTP
jgi:hypothetical protein